MERSCGYGVASLVAAACPAVRGAALQWGFDLESWGATLRALPGGGPYGESGPRPQRCQGAVHVPELPGRHSASLCASLSEQIPSYAEENGGEKNRTILQGMRF